MYWAIPGIIPNTQHICLLYSDIGDDSVGNAPVKQLNQIELKSLDELQYASEVFYKESEAKVIVDLHTLE